MKISGDSNTAMWGAFPDSRPGVDLWDQNLVNGEYVIAYEINPGLDYKLQNMLPKVGVQNLRQKGAEHFHSVVVASPFGQFRPREYFQNAIHFSNNRTVLWKNFLKCGEKQRIISSRYLNTKKSKFQLELNQFKFLRL